MADLDKEDVKVGKKRSARSNQKLKLLYLVQILKENTDPKHDITLQEIIDKLEANDVTAERKSLYDDLEQLRHFGINVEAKKYDRTTHYKIINPDFDIAELKLLVDSVQAAKFIPEEKTNALIKKIEQLTSRPNSIQLNRQIHVAGRVKSINDEVYTNVDAIFNAISADVKIKFHYFSWNERKEMVKKRDGAFYEISPWGVTLDDGNYYLVGYDSDAEMLKHYRVDKMLNVEVMANKREGKELLKTVDMAKYTKKMFSMFDGEEQSVELLCRNSMANVIIDKFGQDVRMLKVDEEHFRAMVRVAVSSHFIHWIMALGDGVKVNGPESAVEKVKAEINRLAGLYN